MSFRISQPEARCLMAHTAGQAPGGPGGDSLYPGATSLSLDCWHLGPISLCGGEGERCPASCGKVSGTPSPRGLATRHGHCPGVGRRCGRDRVPSLGRGWPELQPWLQPCMPAPQSSADPGLIKSKESSSRDPRAAGGRWNKRACVWGEDLPSPTAWGIGCGMGTATLSQEGLQGWGGGL